MKDLFKNIKTELNAQIEKIEYQYGNLEEVIFNEYFSAKAILGALDAPDKTQINAKYDDILEFLLNEYRLNIKSFNSFNGEFHNMNMKDDFINPDLTCLQNYEKELDERY